MRIYVSITFIILLAALSGCSAGISSQQAESAATGFVSEHVKFFSKNESSQVDVNAYNFDSVSSYDAGNAYVVTIHISGEIGNETKQNDLIVKVDKKKGRVFEFNGKKVPE